MNKEDKVFMFDCLKKLNDAIKDSFGEYSFNNSAISAFLKDNEIFIGKYGKNNNLKAKTKQNFLTCYPNEYVKRVRKQEDFAHDILRHIRNSIAHSNVSKNGIKGYKFYTFVDYNSRGNESAKGKIRVDLLGSLIDAIINTRVKKQM